MPRDIRSFFIRSNNSSSDSKNEDISPTKNKKSKTEGNKKAVGVKQRSKKRTIESSDEDELKIIDSVKNKKAKTEKNDDRNDIEEKVQDPSSIFKKQPVQRINSVKIQRKEVETPEKKRTKKPKTDFDDDDDFEATLDQLDTSKIEDEYLSTINNKKESPKKKENEKIDKTSKSSSKDKTINDVKVKNKKDPHPKLEIEKTKANKKKDIKDGNVDFNEMIEEKVEKKKQHAILYQNYLHRGGARNPGCKEVPQGEEQCFENLTFLITGVLESLEREEIEGIIKQYGGKFVHSVSKKLSYMIVGDDPGPSKMAKAESLGIKQISEDEFLDLLRTLPAGPGAKTKNIKQKRELDSSGIEDKNENSIKELNIKKEIETSETIKNSSEKLLLSQKIPKNEIKKESILNEKETSIKAKDIPVSISNVDEVNGCDEIIALSEKYRPKDLKQIIGQTGDKSNAKKLFNWLSNWHKYHGKHASAPKPKFNPRDDTGVMYKAALLSGPPGIGKTTTAYVVSSQLGFEVLEFNASDTRSKKLLKDEISSILSNKTVGSLFKNPSENTQNSTPKHVLLMDEVDGMAGNEDRGGMQELISFIKCTEIPIICICNDRACQKIRSLSNYTFDLRFQKPKLEQIRAAMMSLCFKEGIKISPDELSQIIQSTNLDVRQVINHLALISAKSQTLEEKEHKTKLKNLKLGPWDVIRKVFSAEEHKTMNIRDKSDLFFHDYNIAPLFVYENYPLVNPVGPKTELYAKLAKAAECLAIGDTIEKTIRSNQSWSLLPVQAMFSSALPGTYMSGYMSSQANFPSWLGRNSKASKFDRLLQELTVHARLSTGASKEAINLDYCKMLVNSITRPLVVDGAEGVDKAVEIMNEYHLSREDLDSLIELTQWPHTRDPMQFVDSKVKAAFTRAYNKSANGFSSAGAIRRSARNVKDIDYAEMDGEDPISDEDNDDDDKIENDKLIKAKSTKGKAGSSENKLKTTKKTTNTKKPLARKK